MSRGFLWCLPMLWLLVIAAGFMVYGASGHDDAHINFWFAHTLLERSELVNYNGDRVDQATNLLLVFVTTLFARLLPFDLVTSGYLVDVVASVACCSLLTWLARKICPAVAAWPALIALSCTAFLVWIFGGMGSVLTAFCLLTGVAVWWRFIESPLLKPVHYLALLVITLMLVLVRPEMPLVIPVISVYALVFHWPDAVRRQRCLQILLVNLLGCTLLFFWQKFYFSSWFPMPVIAKQTGNITDRLSYGAIYIAGHGVVNPAVGIALLSSVPVALCLFWKKFFAKPEDGETGARNSLWILLIAAFQVYTGFVWTAGGDWMHAGRFIVPVIPLAALFIASGLLVLVRKPVVVHLLLASLVLLGFGLQPLQFIDGSPGVPVWIRYRMSPEHVTYSPFERYNYEHLRDMQVIDHLGEIIPRLHKQLGRPVQLMSGQAGMVFYKTAEKFPGMVHYTDFHGLVEGSLTLCPLLAESRYRDMYGLTWDGYSEYFRMLPALQEKCGVQPPDVLFEMHNIFHEHPDIFTDAGYVLVHEEQGSLVEADRADRVLPAGKPEIVLNDMFVRRDLLPFLEDQEKHVIDYSSMPLQKRWGYDWFMSLFYRLHNK